MLNFFITAFDLVLYQPLFNTLIIFYNYLPGHDFGLAIILLTLFIKLVLYPLSLKSIKSQKALQKLQPQLEKIQKEYKNDKEKQAKETLELYRKEKMNPFSGLFLALLQLPILIALYKVFWEGLKPEALAYLYAFVATPTSINPVFFGLINLSQPNLALSLLAGALQFFQTKMLLPTAKELSKKGNMASIMQKQMTYVFPIITVIILLKLPSALGLYWSASSIFSIIQQYVVLKKEGTSPLL